MDRIVRLGVEPIVERDISLLVKLPREWLSDYGLEISQPVYSVLTTDGVIRVHLEPQTWTTRSRIRKIGGAGYLTLVREYVKKLDLKKGERLAIDVDLDGGILMLKRAHE